MPQPPRRLGRGLNSLVTNLINPEIEQDPKEPPSSPKKPSLPPSPATAKPRQQGDSVEPVSAPAGAVPRGTAQPTTAQGAVLMMLPISSLRPNHFQPREAMDELALRNLAESIKNSGILQPITARRLPGETAETPAKTEAAGRTSSVYVRVTEGVAAFYEIIAGERRWQAAKLAGLTEVPVMVRDASNDQMLELALIENLQREDLNPVEQARAYRRFCDEFQLKAEDVARRVGEDRSTVANALRLLELPESVLGMLISGRLSKGHAKVLLTEPDKAIRGKLAEWVVRDALSVRRLEEMIKEGQAIRAKRAGGADSATQMALSQANAKTRAQSAHLRSLERRFEDALKTKVLIKEGRRKGSGKITIEYYSIDDFERLMERMGVGAEQ